MSEATPSSAPGSNGPAGNNEQLSPRKRILLAESDGFTRLMLIVRFRMAGFSVDFTSNGNLALRNLRRATPDALLVDLKLNGLSGLELIRSARQDIRFGKRPVYVFTYAGLMKRAVRKEVQATVTKVFDKASISMASMVESISKELIKSEEKKLFGAKTASQSEAKAGAFLGKGALDAAIDRVLMQWESLMQCKDPKERTKSGGELRSRVSELRKCAETAGPSDLATQAKALEGLLYQLCQLPQGLADAAVSLITRAVEVLGALACGQTGKESNTAHFRAAIIDESSASSQALSDALLAAGVKPTTFENPAQARKHLASHPADLIIANVRVPELHGLDLPKIRQLPLHASTPVIFVPESSAPTRDKEALPTSAPSLNLNPSLLTELVMKALNEVQKKDAPIAQEPQPIVPPKPGPQAPVVAAANPVDLSALAAVGLSFQARPEAPEASEEETVDADAPAVAMGAEPADQTAGATAPRGNGTQTILFIEDDPFAVKVYTKALKRSGFRVEVVEDGQAAIQVFPQLGPDLVVLDLMLPKMHGLEVIKFIRSYSQLKDTPVLVLSNAYLDQLGAKARQAGANDGLAKTECSPEKLVQRVCGLLGQGQAGGAGGTGAAEPAVLLADNPELAAETAIWVRQAGLRKEAPKEVAQIRQVCLDCIKAVDREHGLVHLTDLFRRVRFLSAHAALIGFTKIADVSSALEGLLFEIMFNHLHPASSTFQTIAQGVDLLDQLVRLNDTTYAEPRVKPRMLVVDYDPASNISLVDNLKRGNFDALGVQDSVEGLRMLKAARFDLALLDINMPHLNGFQMCEQLRRMPQYKTVPVVFLTNQLEFKDRALGVISGGNDLIAKSVSPLELILKMTMHLLKPGASAGANPPGPSETEDENNPLNARWSVEDVFNPESAPAAPEQPALVLANSPEAVEDAAAAEGVGVEASQFTVAGEVFAENLFEIPPALSNEAAVVTPTTESQFDSAESRIPFTENPSAFLPQPAEEPEQLAGESALPAADETVEPAVPQTDTEPDASLNQDASVPDAAPAVPDAPADAERSLEAAAGAEAIPSEPEPAEPVDLFAKYEQEREKLVNRIFTAENDLHRAQARLKRREATIESLQKQLEEFSALKAQLAQAKSEQQQEAQARASQLEQELASSRQAREELEARLAKEQQASAEAATHLKKLEQQLAELQQAREQLNAQFAQEQQARAELGQRVKDLENNLNQRASELEQSRVESDKQAKEREHAEAELRQQLEVAHAATSQGEAAHKQAQARCGELEQELAGLRQAREQVSTQFAQEQQTSAESGKRVKELEKQLGQRALELEQAKAGSEHQAKDRGRVEAELRRQLETANAAAKHGEVAHKQALARCAELEQELSGLCQAREHLNAQFAKEQQVSGESGKRIKELEKQLTQRASELEQAKAESEHRAKERGRVEAELRQQLDVANSAAKQGEAAQKQNEARYTALEKELADARQAREEFQTNFAQEQRASAELKSRLKDMETLLGNRQVEQERGKAALEKQLSQRFSEFEQAKAESEKQAKERGRVEAELRQQLEAANAAAKHGEAAQKQNEARYTALEKELSGARQAREELQANFAQEQRASAELKSRLKDMETLLSNRQVEQERGKAALEKQLSQRFSELEQAKAELDKQAKERGRVEAELRQQLEAVNAAAKHGEVGQKQSQARCTELETELAKVRQASEELNTQFIQKSQISAELSKRVKELEKQLGQWASEFEKAEAESQKHAKARRRAEMDLRHQFESASTAAKQSEAAHKQAEARCGELERELAGLRQAREQLNAQFVKEQQVSAESGKRVKELEKQLSQRSSELEQAKAESERQAKAQGRVESDLRRQFEMASAAAKQGEAAHKQAQAAHKQAEANHKLAEARCSELEQNLAGLRQAREQLNAQFVKEQQLSAESGKRVKELEKQVGQRSSELEQAKAESEKQAKAHGRVESELRRQLETASAATKQSDAAHKLTQARSAELEQELAGVRQARERLNAQYAQEQQASAASGQRVKELEKQLGQRISELEQAKAESEKQAKERGRVESELRQQLDSASAASKQNEAAHKQAQARCAGLDQELSALRHAREQLNAQLTQAQQTSAESGKRVKELETQVSKRASELEQAKAELEKQAKERARVEAELSRQLEAANAAGKQSEAAHKQAQARCNELDHQLSDLRQAREQLNAQFVQAQQLVAESGQRVKGLEKQCADRASELEQAKAESDKQAKTHASTESELRRQLESSGAAHAQAQSRVTQLEQQVSAQQQASEELSRNLNQAQQANAESAQRLHALESQLSERLAEIERLRSQSEKQANEHSRIASELRAQLEAVGNAHNQTQTRVAQLQQEMTALRQGREDLAGKLAKAQQSGVESTARVKELEKQLQSLTAERTAQTSELEQRIQQGVAALARVTNDLAQERGQRERSDERAAALNLELQELHEESMRMLECHRADQARLASLEGQLRQRDEAITRHTADLEHALAERQLTEEQLQAAKELNAHFRKNLSFFEGAHRTFNSTRQDLETRVANGLSSLKDTHSNLQREGAERQSLASTLDQVQRELQEQSRKRETLERDLQTTVQGLQSSQSKFQQESAERQRLHQALELVQTELQKQARKCETLEAELQATAGALKDSQSKFQQEAAEHQRLHQALESAQHELQNQRRKGETLDADLQATLKARQESDSRLQQESAERQRLRQALETAQLTHRDHAQRTELALSQLRTALQIEQVERKRQETQSIRMRQYTLAAARGARQLRNTLRRQIRQPVDNLYFASRNLLQLDMGSEQRKLAEAMLQDVLLVRTRLQETEAPQAKATQPGSNGGNGEPTGRQG